MIVYGHVVYASPPRTGTSWMLGAFERAGLGRGYKAHVHKPFDDEPGEHLRVMTIRHPCDWLASYWAAIHPGQVRVPCIDRFSKEISKCGFDDFIRQYLRRMPGAVTDMYCEYGSDTCLRLEDMPYAMMELLDSMGVDEEQRKRIGKMGASNRTTGRKHKRALPEWNPSLWDAVIEAERMIIDNYQYRES